MMCPHCQKEIVVRLLKDDGKQGGMASSPQSSPRADITGLGDLLDSINIDALEREEAAFVEQTRERFDQYKGRTMLSEKQLAWLRCLADKSL